MRFNKIILLAPNAPGVDTALEHAVGIARKSGALLTVVGVVDGPAGAVLGLVQTASHTERTLARTTCKAGLDRLVERFRKRGVTIVTRILVGKPALEIPRQIRQNGHDLLILPAATKRNGKAWPPGNIVVELMRKSPCAVWVAYPTAPGRSGILAAVNPGSPEDQEAILSRCILELAASVARMEGSDLHVVHVWNLIGESILISPRVNAQPDRVAELLHKAFHRAKDQMEQLLQQVDLRGITCKPYLVKSRHPAQAIARIAAWKQVSVVAMGTMGRSGLAGRIVGNSAEEVLRNVNCSILTVKPDDSRSLLKAA